MQVRALPGAPRTFYNIAPRIKLVYSLTESETYAADLQTRHNQNDQAGHVGSRVLRV